MSRTRSSRLGLTHITTGHYLDYEDGEGQIGQLKRWADGWSYKLKGGKWLGRYPSLGEARHGLYSAYLDRVLDEPSQT